MKTEVVNTYDQLRHAKEHGVPPVAVVENTGGARNDYFSGYAVYHLHEKTDPNAPWYERGRKVFHVHRSHGRSTAESKRLCLAEAEAWAAEKYGVKKWQRNRMRDSVPAPLNTLYPLRNHNS